MSPASVYIIGDNKVGSEVSALVVPYNPNQEYSYQWYRSSLFDGDYEEIFNAIDSKYTVQISDSYIKCIVSDGDVTLETNILVVDNEVKQTEVNNTEELASTVGSGLKLEGLVSAVSGASNKVSDLARINQSIQLILDTAYGEVPMLPSFGSNLHRFLYSPITEENLSLLEEEVKSALETQEPRIEILQVATEYDDNYDPNNPNDQLDHTVLVTITYQVTGTNITSSYLYSVNDNEEGGGEIYE